MGVRLGMCASADVLGETDIRYMRTHDGITEISFDNQVLLLTASDEGLTKLAKVVKAAVREQRAHERGEHQR